MRTSRRYRRRASSGSAQAALDLGAERDISGQAYGVARIVDESANRIAGAI